MSPTLFAVFSACQSPVSDYELTILPVWLEDQAAATLEDEPEIRVRLVYPDAEPEVLFAGVAREGEALQLPDLPPIPADTVVQLIASEPGGAKAEWDPETTLAFGSSTVSEALAEGGKKIELTIELARIDDVGRVAGLRPADRKVDAAAAVVAGAAYVFGGGDPTTNERTVGFSVGALALISSDTVLKATRTDEGWSELVEVGKMPEYSSVLGFPGDPAKVTTANRAGLAASPVEIDGETRILVTGGRYADFPAYVGDSWFLWDPDTDSVAGEGDLAQERADHLSFRLGPNRVLVYGGSGGTGEGPPLYEIWKAATLRSDSGGTTLSTGGMMAAGTELGDDAVICGGYRISLRDSEQVLWDPSNVCHRITPSDRVTDLEPLPVAVGAASLAALPDGGLLLTGGITAQISEEVINNAQIIGTATVEPALAQAFRWDPDRDEWRELPPLNLARAHHTSLALPNGKVLIIGGNETGSAFFGAVTDPVRCSELFDPETDTFTDAGCSDAARGGGLPVGRGDEDFFVLEGTWWEELDRAGGSSYGVVRRLPE